jgi:hypothetical protein
MPIFPIKGLPTFTQVKTKNRQSLPALKNITMKKWLPDIIYKLFRFLLGYFFPCKAKNNNETRRRTTAPVKAAFMHVIPCFMICFSAPGEKTLWRHTVFRGGISALIHL